jgi:putative addiction module component (TIGR02574 family)
MEVQFTPETEKKLNALAMQSGRRTDDLIEEAMAGYFDEVAHVRDMLDRRYDDLKSGKVKPISGEEVFARLRAKSEARKTKSGS